MKKLVIVILLLTFTMLAGCTHVSQSKLLANKHTQDELTELLAADIRALSDTIDPKEAYLLADTAIKTTYRLVDEYGMTNAKSPEYHNFLVNIGKRPRGLCWHWASDLLSAFYALHLQTIDFKWAVANNGSHLNEHNVVVILPAAAMVFKEGLIYDPWRTAGKPYWLMMKNDNKRDYPWKELPREDW